MVVLAIAVERFVYFFRTREGKSKSTTEIDKWNNQIKGVTSHPENLVFGRNQAHRIVRCFYKNSSNAEDILEEQLDREVDSLKNEMGKRQNVLSFIINAAPQLGLLGTITGLMASFSQIEAFGGAVDMALLSGGIWKAMITTATGLVTALCALRVSRIIEQQEHDRLSNISFLISLLHQKRQKDNLPTVLISDNVHHLVAEIPYLMNHYV